MFSFDFSDDEVCSKFLVSISYLLLVIFGYQESFLVNFISFIGKVSFVFRILKYVNKVKFFDIYTESKKVVKQDSGIQENLVLFIYFGIRDIELVFFVDGVELVEEFF